jgi:hypothetical protein
MQDGRLGDITRVLDIRTNAVLNMTITARGRTPRIAINALMETLSIVLDVARVTM